MDSTSGEGIGSREEDNADAWDTAHVTPLTAKHELSCIVASRCFVLHATTAHPTSTTGTASGVDTPTTAIPHHTLSLPPTALAAAAAWRGGRGGATSPTTRSLAAAGSSVLSGVNGVFVGGMAPLFTSAFSAPSYSSVSPVVVNEQDRKLDRRDGGESAGNEAEKEEGGETSVALMELIGATLATAEGDSQWLGESSALQWRQTPELNGQYRGVRSIRNIAPCLIRCAFDEGTTTTATTTTRITSRSNGSGGSTLGRHQASGASAPSLFTENTLLGAAQLIHLPRMLEHRSPSFTYSSFTSGPVTSTDANSLPASHPSSRPFAHVAVSPVPPSARAPTPPSAHPVSWCGPSGGLQTCSTSSLLSNTASIPSEHRVTFVDPLEIVAEAELSFVGVHFESHVSVRGTGPVQFVRCTFSFQTPAQISQTFLIQRVPPVRQVRSGRRRRYGTSLGGGGGASDGDAVRWITKNLEPHTDANASDSVDTAQATLGDVRSDDDSEGTASSTAGDGKESWPVHGMCGSGSGGLSCGFAAPRAICMMRSRGLLESPAVALAVNTRSPMPSATGSCAADLTRPSSPAAPHGSPSPPAPPLGPPPAGVAAAAGGPEAVNGGGDDSTSPTLSAVEVKEGVRCVFDQCDLYGGCGGTSLLCQDTSHATVTDCSFVGPSITWAAVEIRNDAEVILKNANIRRLMGVGVLVLDRGRATLDSCLVEKCGIAGVVATDDAELVLENTGIESSISGVCVSLSGSSGARLFGCSIVTRLPLRPSMAGRTYLATWPMPGIPTSAHSLGGPNLPFTNSASAGVGALTAPDLWMQRLLAADMEVLLGLWMLCAGAEDVDYITSAQSIVLTDHATAQVKECTFDCCAMWPDPAALQTSPGVGPASSATTAPITSQEIGAVSRGDTSRCEEHRPGLQRATPTQEKAACERNPTAAAAAVVEGKAAEMGRESRADDAAAITPPTPDLPLLTRLLVSGLLGCYATAREVLGDFLTARRGRSHGTLPAVSSSPLTPSEPHRDAAPTDPDANIRRHGGGDDGADTGPHERHDGPLGDRTEEVHQPLTPVTILVTRGAATSCENDPGEPNLRRRLSGDGTEYFFVLEKSKVDSDAAQRGPSHPASALRPPHPHRRLARALLLQFQQSLEAMGCLGILASAQGGAYHLVLSGGAWLKLSASQLSLPVPPPATTVGGSPNGASGGAILCASGDTSRILSDQAMRARPAVPPFVAAVLDYRTQRTLKPASGAEATAAMKSFAGVTQETPEGGGVEGLPASAATQRCCRIFTHKNAILYQCAIMPNSVVADEETLPASGCSDVACDGDAEASAANHPGRSTLQEEARERTPDGAVRHDKAAAAAAEKNAAAPPPPPQKLSHVLTAPVGFNTAAWGLVLVEPRLSSTLTPLETSMREFDVNAMMRWQSGEWCRMEVATPLAPEREDGSARSRSPEDTSALPAATVPSTVPPVHSLESTFSSPLRTATSTAASSAVLEQGNIFLNMADQTEMLSVTRLRHVCTSFSHFASTMGLSAARYCPSQPTFDPASVILCRNRGGSGYTTGDSSALRDIRQQSSSLLKAGASAGDRAVSSVVTAATTSSKHVLTTPSSEWEASQLQVSTNLQRRMMLEDVDAPPFFTALSTCCTSSLEGRRHSAGVGSTEQCSFVNEQFRCDSSALALSRNSSGAARRKSSAQQPGESQSATGVLALSDPHLVDCLDAGGARKDGGSGAVVVPISPPTLSMIDVDSITLSTTLTNTSAFMQSGSSESTRQVATRNWKTNTGYVQWAKGGSNNSVPGTSEEGTGSVRATPSLSLPSTRALPPSHSELAHPWRGYEEDMFAPSSSLSAVLPPVASVSPLSLPASQPRSSMPSLNASTVENVAPQAGNGSVGKTASQSMVGIPHRSTPELAVIPSVSDTPLVACIRSTSPVTLHSASLSTTCDTYTVSPAASPLDDHHDDVSSPNAEAEEDPDIFSPCPPPRELAVSQGDAAGSTPTTAPFIASGCGFAAEPLQHRRAATTCQMHMGGPSSTTGDGVPSVERVGLSRGCPSLSGDSQSSTTVFHQSQHQTLLVDVPATDVQLRCAVRGRTSPLQEPTPDRMAYVEKRIEELQRVVLEQRALLAELQRTNREEALRAASPTHDTATEAGSRAPHVFGVPMKPSYPPTPASPPSQAANRAGVVEELEAMDSNAVHAPSQKGSSSAAIPLPEEGRALSCSDNGQSSLIIPKPPPYPRDHLPTVLLCPKVPLPLSQVPSDGCAGASSTPSCVFGDSPSCSFSDTQHGISVAPESHESQSLRRLSALVSIITTVPTTTIPEQTFAVDARTSATEEAPQLGKLPQSSALAKSLVTPCWWKHDAGTVERMEEKASEKVTVAMCSAGGGACCSDSRSPPVQRRQHPRAISGSTIRRTTEKRSDVPSASRKAQQKGKAARTPSAVALSHVRTPYLSPALSLMSTGSYSSQSATTTTLREPASASVRHVPPTRPPPPSAGTSLYRRRRTTCSALEALLQVAQHTVANSGATVDPTQTPRSKSRATTVGVANTFMERRVGGGLSTAGGGTAWVTSDPHHLHKSGTFSPLNEYLPRLQRRRTSAHHHRRGLHGFGEEVGWRTDLNAAGGIGRDAAPFSGQQRVSLGSGIQYGLHPPPHPYAAPAAADPRRADLRAGEARQKRPQVEMPRPPGVPATASLAIAPCSTLPLPLPTPDACSGSFLHPSRQSMLASATRTSLDNHPSPDAKQSLLSLRSSRFVAQGRSRNP